MTQIRRATPDDAPAVARLLHDFNTEYDDFTPGVEVLTRNAREMLAAGDMVVLLAGEGPDGLAELRFRKSVWTARLDAYLEELYVVPALRGQGIGRALLREAMDLARVEGAVHMDLGTSEDDEASFSCLDLRLAGKDGLGPDPSKEGELHVHRTRSAAPHHHHHRSRHLDPEIHPHDNLEEA